MEEKILEIVKVSRNNGLTKQEVYKIIKRHKEIKKINHFNSTPIGYLYQISFTIFVDGNLTTFESHEIADNLEKEIKTLISDGLKNIDIPSNNTIVKKF